MSITEDNDQVQAVLAEWTRHPELFREPYGPPDFTRVDMARHAVMALTPTCGARHPQRPDSETIACTDQANHVPAGRHSNAQFGLTWTDDWTTHDELGDIELLIDPGSLDGGRDDSDQPLPAAQLMDVLKEAHSALERVERAYHESTSKRITAPMYRPVRAARANLDAWVTALSKVVDLDA